MTHHNKCRFSRIDTKRSWRAYAVLALVIFTALPLPSYAAEPATTPEVEPVTNGNTGLVLDASVSVAGALRFGGKNIPSQLKIMPLGDSITAGPANPELVYNGSYRTKLWQLLNSASVNFDYVGGSSSGTVDLPDHDHEGHGGIWIKDNRISSSYSLYDHVIEWLNVCNPDLVLLHIGTNDLSNGDSASLSAQKLDALLDRIITTKPKVHIVVALIIPPQLSNDGWQDYNTFTKAVVDSYAAKGYHISTADMSSILAGSDYADRLHPAKSGYDKMAEAWYPAIQTMLGNW